MNHPRPNPSAAKHSLGALAFDAALLMAVAVTTGLVVGFQQSQWGQATLSPQTMRPLAAAVLIAGQAVVLAYLATMLGPRQSPAGALLGIGLRTGVPMAALVMVKEMAPVWAEHGFAGFLVACYLPCLAAETTLAAWRLSRRNQSSSASPAFPGPSS